jgi:hypothetical protein
VRNHFTRNSQDADADDGADNDSNAEPRAETPKKLTLSHPPTITGRPRRAHDGRTKRRPFTAARAYALKCWDYTGNRRVDAINRVL